MKTTEEIVFDITGIKLQTYSMNQNVVVDKQELIQIVQQAQKDAYNQALEDAAENAKTRTNDESTSIIIDKQSILKLKKP